jgi:hypothetical protein
MVMVLVKTIFLRLKTKRIAGGGTDGDPYLGIGGREFFIDSFDPDVNDFESGSNRQYYFGATPPTPFTQIGVSSPQFNDPRKPDPLITDNMDQFPVYIRFEPKHKDDFWCVEEVEVRVNPVGNTQVKKYAALPGSANFLWLGPGRGKYLGLFSVTAPL